MDRGRRDRVGAEQVADARRLGAALGREVALGRAVVEPEAGGVEIPRCQRVPD